MDEAECQVDEERFSNETETIIDEDKKLFDPPLFNVIIHNDDYTTMEFVVCVLETVFNKSHIEANRIMMNVHQKGRGICGTYPFEIAETKVEKVIALARKEEFPLRCTVEES